MAYDSHATMSKLQLFGSSSGAVLPHLQTNKLIEESLEFWPAFLNSLAMILVTELGDKTFFIAAIMAMRNPRLVHSYLVEYHPNE